MTHWHHFLSEIDQVKQILLFSVLPTLIFPFGFVAVNLNFYIFHILG